MTATNKSPSERSELDIRNLADLIDVEPSRSEHADYRWRIRCRKEEWVNAVRQMALEIDYDNFKNRIDDDDPDRAHVYTRVWADMLEIQRGS